MFILLVNCFFYFFATYFFAKKNNKSISLETIVLGVFSFFALLGCITYSTGIYEATFGNKDENTLSIVPYIYCFLFILISIIPLRGNVLVTEMNCDLDPHKKKVITKIFFAVQSLSLLLTLLLSAQKGFSFDYAEIYADAANGNSAHFDSSFLQSLYGKSLFIFRLAPFFIWFFCFDTLKKQWSKKAFLIIVLTFISQIIPCILHANRGGMFFCVVLFLSFYLFFRNKLVGKARRCIIISSIALFTSVSIFSFAISLSRAGDNINDAQNAVILRYFGEPFPNLGFNIWGHNITHPMGARFFPSFLGKDISSYTMEGRNGGFFYWERVVGIRMLNFKTIFGDTYIEFGVLGGFAFLIISTLIIKSSYRIIPNAWMPIVYFFYFNTCVWNVFLNKWGDERTWKDYILLLIIIMMLNRYCKLKKD